MPNLAAAGVSASIVLPIALLRFLDGDEGVYAYASRLAVHGYVPYGAFFFGQTPLLPYVYGAWFGIAGESWYSARILSALLTITVGVLLHWHVRRKLGTVPAAVALLVYASSGFVLGYFTLVKTFALSTLLLFGAYLLADAGLFLWAGAALGLALDTRLLFAAAIPAFGVVALTARRAPALVAGLVALAPAAVLVALHPSAWYFDSLRYDALRTSHGLVGDVHQKAQTAATLLGVEPTDRALGIQFLLLTAACVAALVLARGRARSSFALAIAASLGIVSLFPTPTYVQYFSVTVPFLAVGVAELVARTRPNVGALLFGGVCGAVYLAATGFAVRHFTDYDALLRPSIGSVRAVAKRVEDESSPGERVLSSWPGYLIGTHAWALPDYTNQFAPVAAAKISPAERRRFHVASESELEQRIRERDVRLVVYRNWVTSPPFARWGAALRAGRYRLLATVETARIFRR
jgi:hypothetical protein